MSNNRAARQLTPKRHYTRRPMTKTEISKLIMSVVREVREEFGVLSMTEIKVSELSERGWSTEKIAARIDRSPRTIRRMLKHVNDVRAKRRALRQAKRHAGTNLGRKGAQ